MMRFLTLLVLSMFLSNPAQAFTAGSGIFDDLEFVSDTRIPGPQGSTLSLCYTTRNFLLLGYVVSSDITGYALASDACTRRADRLFSAEQMQTAQSLNLIDASLPPVAQNTLARTLQNLAIWLAIVLAIIAVIIRRIKSLLGMDLRGPMRKKAYNRILTAMCHAGRADGVVDSKEIALISKAAGRLTRRSVKTSEVIRITDHLDPALSEHDFIELGRGLRDSEKDVMMQGVFFVTIANGRLLPDEYDFITSLAYGIGMPGEDFRRVMNLAIADLDQ